MISKFAIIGLIFSIAITSFTINNVFASAPALPSAVRVSPFYWSENGFGLDILKSFNLPIDPYLTEGVTEQSSKEEIIKAFLEANANLTSKIIVSDNERAQVFVVNFSQGGIEGTKTSTTFSKFTPNNPFDTRSLQFSLESLPSMDKTEFYKFVNKWKEQGTAQNLFDVDIEIISGDGTAIQNWHYSSCLITDYIVYKQENKNTFGFARVFNSEIRDKTTFQCEGFTLNPDQRQSTLNSTSITPASFVSDNSQRIETFAVRFNERLLKPSSPPFTTFSKFTHFFDVKDVQIDLPIEIPPIEVPGKTFEGKQQFSLESLPNTEHELFYQLVNNWIKGVFADKFDVYIDFITGDGTILQTWEYTNCEITDYSTFLQENLLTYKFAGLLPAEIHDKTNFACGDLILNFDQQKSSLAKNVPINSLELIPQKNDRAQIYVTHFSGGKLTKPLTIPTFSKFTPNSPFDKPNQGFSLESLPSKDKHEIYQLVKDWLEGIFPQPFDVDIDLVTGDGTIIETWKYSTCNIIDYSAFLNDNLFTYKFNGELIPEIRDKLSMDCGGLTLNTDKRPSSMGISEIIPTNFVPDPDDSAKNFVIHASGGKMPQQISFETISKFTPNNPFDTRGLGFSLESLPSKEMIPFYQYINNWKTMPSALEPFDVDIDLVTGDGTIIETWKYQKCEITDYVTNLNDNLLTIRFHGKMNYEIRDKTSFGCDAFVLIVEQKKSSPILNPIPDDNERAKRFVVHFSDGLLPRKITITVPKFTPVNAEDTVLPLPGKTFDEKPQFVLATLPNKDFVPLYEGISNWESKSAIVSQFNADVDVVSGDDTIIQTWKYTNCEPTNYFVTLEHSISFFPFSNEFGSEIRDNILFECRFFELATYEENSMRNDTKTNDSRPISTLIPSPRVQILQGIPLNEIICKDGFESVLKPSKNSIACVKPTTLDTLAKRGWLVTEKTNIVPAEQAELFITGDTITESERAESFVVRISGGLIQEEKIFRTFSNFAPLYEKAEIPISLPNYPFGSTSPHFALESLTSKDKAEFYQLVNDWLTGTFPQPFDVSVDVVSGDGTILQTWEYRTCDITGYETALDERLDRIKYHDRYQSEIIDKTIFDCSNLKINPSKIIQ